MDCMVRLAAGPRSRGAASRRVRVAPPSGRLARPGATPERRAVVGRLAVGQALLGQRFERGPEVVVADEPGAQELRVAQVLVEVGRARGLVRQGAVGDLLVHPFTATGRFLAPDLAARALAIGIDELRRIPTVVAVASGTAKIAAIRGALATGVLGVLVTSAGTARGLLA